MKKLIFTIITFMVGMTTFAQTTRTVTIQPADAPEDNEPHAMTIYFVDGTTVSYTLDDLASITYLPGVGMKLHLSNTSECKDYLYSQMTKIEYQIEGGSVVEDGNANANWKEFDLSSTTSGNMSYAYRLEYPHLNSNLYSTSNRNGNQVVVKSTAKYGITYSLEWDNSKVANRWTCYTLHSGNMESNVDRSDSFKEDTEVYRSPSSKYASGYSRGHLCPSADRLCSREQNSQTFFMTNMQPQYQNHNGVLWERMEEKTREFAGSYCDTRCDTLYVVKAATISDVTLDGQTISGVYTDRTCASGSYNLPVPKYFYMAFLHYNKSTDKYHAMAFWTVHENVMDKNTNFGDYAISIDELEKRTGIDFFCNLPDDIEEEVEAELDLGFWNITKSK